MILVWIKKSSHKNQLPGGKALHGKREKKKKKVKVNGSNGQLHSMYIELFLSDQAKVEFVKLETDFKWKIIKVIKWKSVKQFK